MGKNLPTNAGDEGSIPGLGISPEEGNGNPLQYFCLGNPVDREACQTTVHGVTESDTTEELSIYGYGLDVREKRTEDRPLGFGAVSLLAGLSGDILYRAGEV